MACWAVEKKKRRKRKKKTERMEQNPSQRAGPSRRRAGCPMTRSLTSSH